MLRTLSIALRGRAFDLGSRTVVMGVLNVTPDSFSDGGRLPSIDAALRQAEVLLEGGADLLDVGGESSRPGTAAPLAAAEELRRVVPVVEALRRRFDAPLSIDTYKASVARAAVEAGAALVNDISALRFDPEMAATVQQLGVPVVLMHSRGAFSSLHAPQTYGDVGAEVAAELAASLETAVAAGIAPSRLVVDPGFGFSKNAAQSLALLADLESVVALGYPVLVGTSRKSFLGALIDRPVEARDEATAASVVAAILGGAHLVRVHAPAAVRDAVRVADAIRAARTRRTAAGPA